MANVDLKTNFKNGDKLYDYELNNNFKAIQAALGAMNKIVWQNDDNASLVMFAGTTEQITNRELIEGQLLYNTQTGETYIDAMVDTELKRISTGGGTSIQIGGIEPTNPATKLWVEDDMLNSLGTEIESGSNENGFWIKFADGTLICIGDTTEVLTSEISESNFLVTYPIAFVNYPSVTISNVYSYYRDLILSVAVPTLSNFKVNWYKQSGTAAANSNIRVYWIAIGRWK